MNRKYTIIAGMCMLFLNCVGLGAADKPHQIAAIEADIAEVEETEEHRVRRQAAESHAAGIKGEEVKQERIRELLASRHRYDVANVTIAASGKKIGHIDSTKDPVEGFAIKLTLENGQKLITLNGMTTVPTEDGQVKLGKFLLPRTTVPIKNSNDIMDYNGRLITPGVQLILSDIPAYGAVSNEEMLIILLLLQMNEINPPQGAIPNYPTKLIDGRDVFDDLLMLSTLTHQDLLYLTRLIWKTSELAHRYSRRLNIGEYCFKVLLGNTHPDATKSVLYTQRLEEFNAFAPVDKDHLLFVP